MHRSLPIEEPPRASGVVSPWVEVSAWLLAFVLLLGAHCAPDRAAGASASRQADVAQRR
jgi:hypothetical protein